jgi:polysaccharide export outer membrane protein
MKPALLMLAALTLLLTYIPLAISDEPSEYTVGIEDVLEISVLQPEKLITTTTVAPDGSISFPYIGNVPVKGMTLGEIQEDIQAKLADGYMKYPVVSVSLQASRSRKFFVYGEVIRPGTYAIEENVTVLKAISMAGGFTRFGSSSRVKVLRLREEGAGYQALKVNIKGVMDGDPDADIILKPEDIVVVSEGVF